MAEKDRIRRKEFRVKVTEDEYRIAKEKADYAFQGNVSAYIRSLMVDGVVITYDSENIIRMIYEINRIGNNINQIAKNVNGKGNVEEEDVIRLQEQYEGLFACYTDYVYEK